MSKIDIFETTNTEVLKIKISDLKGYSLWYGDEYDKVLALSGNILLFASQKNLINFVLNGANCNICETESYLQLQKYLKKRKKREGLPYLSYNFNKIVGALTSIQDRVWSMQKCAEVLNALNLVFDLANTSNDEWILKQLERGATDLSELMDRLTFMTKKDQKTLLELNYDMIGRTYGEIIQRLTSRILMIC